MKAEIKYTEILIQKLFLCGKNKVSLQTCDKSIQEKRNKLEMHKEYNTHRRYKYRKNAI